MLSSIITYFHSNQIPCKDIENLHPSTKNKASCHLNPCRTNTSTVINAGSYRANDDGSIDCSISKKTQTLAKACIMCSHFFTH